MEQQRTDKTTALTSLDVNFGYREQQTLEVCLVYGLVEALTSGKIDIKRVDAGLKKSWAQRNNSLITSLVAIQQRLSDVEISTPLEYLKSLDALFPDKLVSRVKNRHEAANFSQFFEEVVVELSSNGNLDPSHLAQPDMEKWVGNVIEQIMEPLFNSNPFATHNPSECAKQLAALFIMLAQKVHEMEIRVTKDIGESKRCLKAGFFAIGSWEIRGSLIAVLMREAYCRIDPETHHKFLATCSDICKTRIRTDYLQGSKSRSMAANYLNNIKYYLHEFISAAEISQQFLYLSNLEKYCPYKEPLTREASIQNCRHLPVGEVILISTYKEIDTPVLVKFDGRRGHVVVGICTMDDKHVLPMRFTDTETKSIRNCCISGWQGGAIDEKGKLYNAESNRFSPAAHHLNWYKKVSSLLDRIATDSYDSLFKLWKLHPRLFSGLKYQPPIILCLSDDCPTLVIAKSLDDSEILEVNKAPSDLGTLVDCLYHGDAKAWLLNEAIAEEELTTSQLSVVDQSSWKRIYQSMPGGKFTFDWLYERLKAFEVRIDTEAGKGSHYMLRRCTADGEMSYSLSKRFRKDSNVASMLKTILNGLDISLEQFAQKL